MEQMRDGMVVLDTTRIVGLNRLKLARALHPDVIPMDLSMPRLDGLAGVRRIKAELPDTRIVILTPSAADKELFEATKSGACGYILKGKSGDEVLALLGEVERGEVACRFGLAGRILRKLAKQANTLQPTGLSGREREVLRLVAQGFKYKEVATKLDLTERTVKFQMARSSTGCNSGIAASSSNRPGTAAWLGDESVKRCNSSIIRKVQCTFYSRTTWPFLINWYFDMRTVVREVTAVLGDRREPGTVRRSTCGVLRRATARRRRAAACPATRRGCIRHHDRLSSVRDSLMARRGPICYSLALISRRIRHW